MAAAGDSPVTLCRAPASDVPAADLETEAISSARTFQSQLRLGMLRRATAAGSAWTGVVPRRCAPLPNALSVPALPLPSSGLFEEPVEIRPACPSGLCRRTYVRLVTSDHERLFVVKTSRRTLVSRTGVCIRCLRDLA